MREPIWVKATRPDVPVPRGPGHGRRNPITAERPALVDGKSTYILGRLRDGEVVEIKEAEARTLLAKAKAEAEAKAKAEAKARAKAEADAKAKAEAEAKAAAEAKAEAEVQAEPEAAAEPEVKGGRKK